MLFYCFRLYLDSDFVMKTTVFMSIDLIFFSLKFLHLKRNFSRLNGISIASRKHCLASHVGHLP